MAMSFRKVRLWAMLILLPICLAIYIPWYLHERSVLMGLMPEAAAMPISDFKRLVASSATPQLDDFENQPLTFVVLTERFGKLLDKHPTSDMKFEAGKLVDLERALAGGELDSATSISLLRKEYLTGLDFDNKKGKESGTVKGVVTFEAPGIYSGKLDFFAEKHADSYRITAFVFPELGVRVERTGPNSWRARFPNSSR